MKHQHKKFFTATLVFCCFLYAGIAQPNAVKDGMMSLMQKEMKREMEALSRQEIPAYFMEYKVVEQVNLSVQAMFGSVMAFSLDSLRTFSAGVRGGSYELDNTHPLPDGSNIGMEISQEILPWSDDPMVLNLEFWNATNSAYELSKEQFKTVINAKEEEGFKNDTPDFSTAPPVNYYEPPLDHHLNGQLLTEWKQTAGELSALFLSDTSFVLGMAGCLASYSRQFSTTTEGQNIIQNKLSATMMVMGVIRTTDNQFVLDMLTFSANTPSELASKEEMTRKVKELIETMKQMRSAPIAQSYSGPALLSPQASGVFFHEIFGHRVEGHRLADINDSQTFLDKVDHQVLPRYINIYFDPTQKEYQGQALSGSYIYDDEGVAAERVQVVDKGVLRNFLMSRKPVKGYGPSNGHGRAMAGLPAVTRQSNMIVETEKSFSVTDLRKKLVAECRKQKKEYGYYFKQVSGGLTLNSVYSPNVFTVFPTEIYRIYADGRPDEPVRQVSLIGTPLMMFSEIEAAGNDPQLFSGFCGAESGSIPVTIVCPSFFVKKIETQKTPEFHFESPILALPSAEAVTKLKE